MRVTHPIIASLVASAAVMCAIGSIGSAQEAESRQEPAGVTDPEAFDFFEKHVLPILKRRCYECHSHQSGKAKGGLVLDSRAGWEKGGGSGPAILPGNPDASLLVQAIRYGDLEMPPEEKLPSGEIARLERWIAMGAPDPRQAESRGIPKEKLWALQPIQRRVPPTPVNSGWTRDELDRFILHQLEAAGLEPNPDADRYTLLRRVTFDLTGLPPTPEEIETFIQDSSDQAYVAVVNRLLDSPAFGDHWARHWFDLACYADLADVEGNVLIRDAWRYRDYVIAAFNSDKPLDRFIHEQVAGDLLPYESVEQRREQIIATGYLAIGPWTLQNYIKPQLDADVVDHQIDRIGRTFLGQTISCARCHDHKFDPIPTRDYYAMAGIFHSTRTTSYDGPGVWSQITHVTLPESKDAPEERARRQEKLESLHARRKELQAELASLVITIPGATDANVLTLASTISVNLKGQRYEVSFEAAPSVWAQARQKTTAEDGLRVDILRSDGSVLASFTHKPGLWSSTRDAQRLRKAKFSYTGDGSGEVRVRLTSANPGSGRFGGAIDDLAIRVGEEILFQEDFDDLQPGSVAGKQVHTGLQVLAQAMVPGWDGGGINHSHAVDLGRGDYAVQFFGGSVVSLASLSPSGEVETQVHTRAMTLDQEIRALDVEINALKMSFAPQQALAVRDVDTPTDSPIYLRGSFQSLGEVVPRGFLSAVPVAGSYAIPPDSSGRLQLAQWLTDSGNPLTSRVLVNRIWHHLFGKGIVRSVEYFGVHGETPSHPQLLDFLALRLREDDGWSLKRTVRRMVLSRTYQMSSAHHPEAEAADPDNRLLARMPRRRLTAESIRDAMLAASGELDPGRGGPSLGLELEGNVLRAGDNVNPAIWGGKIPDAIKKRRSIYFPLPRERPDGELEILSTFDFPHPGEITGARPETTVATQALFLMNAPFVKHQAQTLAQRLAADAAGNERERVHRLYLLTVGRPAQPDEIETALTFLDQCTAHLVAQSDEHQARTVAWVELCHAILGSNHFLFRE